MKPQLNFRRLNKILSLLIAEIKQTDKKTSEVSEQWHYMHIMGCSQLAKLEARKRGLSMELAAIAAALHDYGLLKTGKKENHARIGAELIDTFIDSYNDLSGEKRGRISSGERAIIKSALRHHSEKEIDSGEPYTELLKDVDCLDRYLHGVLTEGAYMQRVEKILKDSIQS